MVELPDRVVGALNGPNFAHLATLLADGSPHNTTMWVNTDGTHVLFNTAEGRRKTANLRRDGRVSVSLFDAESPYHPITIQGRVVELTHDGADDHIDHLAGIYLGADEYPYRRPGEVRVKVVVEPTRVTA